MGETAQRYRTSFRYDLSQPVNRPDWRVRLQRVQFNTVHANNYHRIQSVVLELSCVGGGLPLQFWLTGRENREEKEKVNPDEKGVVSDVRITSVSEGLIGDWEPVPYHHESSMNSLIAVLFDCIDFHENFTGNLQTQLRDLACSLDVDEAEGSRVFRVFEIMPKSRSYHVEIQHDLLPGELLDPSVHILQASICAVRLRRCPKLKHLFLVLEVRFSERNSNRAGKCLSNNPFWITGELNRDKEGGVINVFISPNEPKRVGTDFDMQMDDLHNPSAVQMRWVIDRLISHPSFYDVRKDNCYEYAYAICRKLGTDFAEHCSRREAVLKDLKTLPRPKHLKDVVKKRHVAGGIVATVAAVGVVWMMATSCPPLTIAAVIIAPEATVVTAGFLLITPSLGVGISSTVKLRNVVRNARVRP